MELLTPREVVSLMQGTTVLIGTHGSGLAHLWFLPRTSSMIVIHAPGTDALLSTKSFADGAPWLIDYQVRRVSCASCVVSCRVSCVVCC